MRSPPVTLPGNVDGPSQGALRTEINHLAGGAAEGPGHLVGVEAGAPREEGVGLDGGEGQLLLLLGFNARCSRVRKGANTWV